MVRGEILPSWATCGCNVSSTSSCQVRESFFAMEWIFSCFDCNFNLHVSIYWFYQNLMDSRRYISAHVSQSTEIQTDAENLMRRNMEWFSSCRQDGAERAEWGESSGKSLRLNWRGHGCHMGSARLYIHNIIEMFKTMIKRHIYIYIIYIYLARAHHPDGQTRFFYWI